MITYIMRRLILLPIVLWGLTILLFASSMFLTPTERVVTYITDIAELRGGQETIKRLIAKYGLDDPFHVQYWRWLNNVIHGNLGWSSSAYMPVTEALGKLFPASLELTLCAAIVIILGGIWLGTLAAVHHNRAIDQFSRVFAIAGWSLPSFVFGLIALAIFYGRLDWFPAGRLSTWATQIVNSSEFHRYTGMNVLDSILNGNWRILLDALRHLVLPVITLAYIEWATVLRIMRSSMLETLRQDYVAVARAKGLPESVVIKKYARRNALLPTTTIAGLIVAYLMGGVVIIETIFNYNGLGRFAAKAAQQLDFPGILGFALFSGSLLVVANLVVDILYAYLDPRVKLG